MGAFCAVQLYLGLMHLCASEANTSQPLFTQAVSYDDSSHEIQEVPHHGRSLFTPLPSTLHELYQRNDAAKKRHASLHAKLMLTLVHNSNRKKIINLFAKYGIGIEYEPNKYLVTRLLDINGIGKFITTSLDTSHDTE